MKRGFSTIFVSTQFSKEDVRGVLVAFSSVFGFFSWLKVTISAVFGTKLDLRSDNFSWFVPQFSPRLRSSNFTDGLCLRN